MQNSLRYEQEANETLIRSKICDILDPLDRCELECDGMTRIISYLLCQSGVSHRVMLGSIRNLETNKTIEPHLWVALDNGLYIDYRARMWLGNNEDIPHGIFDFNEYPLVAYSESPVELSSMNDHLSHILAVINNVPVGQMVDELKCIGE